MYTNIPHQELLKRVQETLEGAWKFEAREREVQSSELTLTANGWEFGAEGDTLRGLLDKLT